MVRIIGFSVTLIALWVGIFLDRRRFNRLDRKLDRIQSDLAERLSRFRLRA